MTHTLIAYVLGILALIVIVRTTRSRR